VIWWATVRRRLALALAIRRPSVRRLVLMQGGRALRAHAGLDAVWGYEPSIDAMRQLLDIFAYDRSIVNDELARLRYEASIRPAFTNRSRPCFRTAPALGRCAGEPRRRHPPHSA
jgi:hypothetical protein